MAAGARLGHRRQAHRTSPAEPSASQWCPLVGAHDTAAVGLRPKRPHPLWEAWWEALTPNSRQRRSHLPLAVPILRPARNAHRRTDRSEPWEMDRCPRSAGSHLLPSPNVSHRRHDWVGHRVPAGPGGTGQHWGSGSPGPPWHSQQPPSSL